MYKNLFTFLLSITVIFSAQAQSQFENASFENWESIAVGPIPEPVDWSSLRTAEPANMAQVAPPVWNVSDDAHTGVHSLYLTNIEIFTIVATGMVTTGRVLASLDTDVANSHTVPDDSKWNLPITHRPDSLVGWYKGKPSPNDFPTAKVLLHTGYAALPQADSSNWIGVAYIELSSNEVDVWTRFSTPFEYFNDEIPEFALAILTSGYGTFAVNGSEAWFDDLLLIYNTDDIDEFTVDNFKAFSHNGELVVRVNESSGLKYQFSIYDITGRNVYNAELFGGQENRFNPGLTAGIYILKANVGNKILSKKIIIE